MNPRIALSGADADTRASVADLADQVLAALPADVPAARRHP